MLVGHFGGTPPQDSRCLWKNLGELCTSSIGWIKVCADVCLYVYLQIAFHGEKAEELGQHSVRLPKDSHVRELLAELRNLLPPAYSTTPLRLLEIYMSKIYKVLLAW